MDMERKPLRADEPKPFRYTRPMRYNPPPRGALASGLLLFLAACLGPPDATAQPVTAPRLEALVGAERAARLLAGDSLVASSGGGALSLAPRHEGARAVGEAVAAESPDVVVEALFLWRPRRGAATATPLPGALAVYNALRAVGSLEGIEYYSASRGRMRTLYERSTLVSDEAGLVPLPDEALAALPAGGEELYARQADTTFGDNVYRLSMRAGDGFVYQASSNVTPMYLGFVRVAAPGGMGLRALVVESAEGLVLYVASSAKALLLPGVRGALETSFGNRAKAVFAWFGVRMDGRMP